jgi:hypothetical protein
VLPIEHALNSFPASKFDALLTLCRNDARHFALIGKQMFDILNEHPARLEIFTALYA